MAHRSGGGSHSGGHHSSSHSSHGSSGPRFSKHPFPNARKFRYFDKHGREMFIYGETMPTKSSKIGLILGLIFFSPFLLAGIGILAQFIFIFFPMKPLSPDYAPTDVHIMDGAGVIDNEESLEETLQEFEDLTGISPYVMTLHDSDWMVDYNYDLSDYAYYAYISTFTDEQHFLVVYSEPENAEELDFVNWSWEAIQGDETDSILTESKFEIFQEDFHSGLLQENISVGEAFENAFEKSKTYMMRGDKQDIFLTGLMAVIWNVLIVTILIGQIKYYKQGQVDYEEVIYGAPAGLSNSGNNAGGQNHPSNQNNVSGQSNATYQKNTTWQTKTVFQTSTGFPSSVPNQSVTTYQSTTGSQKDLKTYMYYDKNGNKKYTKSYMEPYKSAFAIMLVVIFIISLFLIGSIPFLMECISMIREANSLGQKVPALIMVLFISSLIWNLILFTVIFFAVRYYIVCKKRDYVEVSANSGMDYSGLGAGAQYNSSASADSNYYNDDARFRGSEYYNDDARYRGSEYYDDDARYRGSTAYDGDKK